MTKETSNAIDLADIRQEPIAYEITHPKTGENLGIIVKLLPMTDPAIKKVGRQIQDRKNHLNARGKTLKAEEMEEFRIQLCAAAIYGWEWYGDVTFNGSKPEFTPKNVHKVLSEKEWFLDQIDEKVGDTKDFFID